ncbi:hypothetical protein ON010_g15760 [Phytophthora cinnamomi]|nr:hypothetical protein ON010_g15760 [Phytophthora cinnamomi]
MGGRCCRNFTFVHREFANLTAGGANNANMDFSMATRPEYWPCTGIISYYGSICSAAHYWADRAAAKQPQHLPAGGSKNN